MPQPSASVIVPMHNAQEHVKRIIGCLKAQTYTDFEALLVDDGSTDSTVAACEQAIENDKRFSILPQNAQAGPGVARNAGIEAAHGTYLFFFDVDDAIAPQALEHALARAKESDADMVIFQMNQLDVRDGQLRPSPDRWNAAAYPHEFAPSEHAETLFGDFRNWPVDKAFRRDFLDRTNLRFPALYRTEDLAFTCAALAQAKSIALLDEELYTYRIGSTAASTQTRSVAPLDFFESANGLHRTLHTRGLMDTYRHTYTQWVGLSCALNVLELETFDAFERAYRALNEGGLAQLELDSATREQYASDLATDATRAAGEMENADVWLALNVIEHCPVAEGVFHLQNLKQQIQGRHFQGLLGEVYASHSFKLGNALLTPLHILRDRNSAKR